jgi:hypothetical protein
MDNALFEHAAEARAALRAITADQSPGIRDLPDPRTAANLLQDLLADAPRESSILALLPQRGLAAPAARPEASPLTRSAGPARSSLRCRADNPPAPRRGP